MICLIVKMLFRGNRYTYLYFLTGFYRNMLPAIYVVWVRCDQHMSYIIWHYAYKTETPVIPGY